MLNILHCLAIMLTLFSSFASFSSDDVKEIDHEKRWSLYRAKQGDSSVCYIGSFPIKQEGTYKKRDDPYIIVINNDEGDDELSISAGYPYLEKSNVMLSVDGKNNYTLFTRGEFAWANDQETDNIIIDKMKKGLTMRVSAISHKNTKSYDTYSLLGFTKMYNRMKKLCVRGG
ncbi:invasion associated locus B family protein [Candidatus Xenohaliotis californiensis]